MGDGIRLITGKVVVTGEVTDAVRKTLLTRYRKREVVELWRARLEDMAFLAELPELRSLSIVNCRLLDPAPLARCATLRHLFLNQVRPAQGWDFLAGLGQVEVLELLNVRGHLQLPDLAGMTSLRHVRVWGCRGLRTMASLEHAPALESVKCVDTGLEPQDLEALVARPSVRSVESTFRTRAATAELLAMLARHGKQEPEPEPA